MNWWKRKQITHVLLLLLCIGLFSCTADPPVGGAEITAPEEYLNVNHYVETALHSDFPDFLPDREALDLPLIFFVTTMNTAAPRWASRSSLSLCR